MVDDCKDELLWIVGPVFVELGLVIWGVNLYPFEVELTPSCRKSKYLILNFKRVVCSVKKFNVGPKLVEYWFDLFE